MRLSFLAVFVFALAAPSFASAQRHRLALDPSGRAIAYGGLAVGGSNSYSAQSRSLPLIGTVSGSRSVDLVTTGVFGARYEMPLFDYFILAANFGVSRYREDTSNSERRTWIDLGIAPTAALDIDLGKVAIEPRLAVPMGFSLHLFHSGGNDETVYQNGAGFSRTNPGLYIGVLPGIGVYFRRGFGVLFEMGYLHHHAYMSNSAGDKMRIGQSQMVMQGGIAFPF